MFTLILHNTLHMRFPWPHSPPPSVQVCIHSGHPLGSTGCTHACYHHGSHQNRSAKTRLWNKGRGKLSLKLEMLSDLTRREIGLWILCCCLCFFITVYKQLTIFWQCADLKSLIRTFDYQNWMYLILMFNLPIIQLHTLL